MANIELAVVPGKLDAAICPRCPGGAKIFPASDLAAHIARHDVKEGVFPCKKCGRPFKHALNEALGRPAVSICGYCRKAGKPSPKKGKGTRKKHGYRTEEKAESIRSVGTKPRTTRR